MYWSGARISVFCPRLTLSQDVGETVGRLLQLSCADLSERFRSPLQQPTTGR